MPLFVIRDKFEAESDFVIIGTIELASLRPVTKSGVEGINGLLDTPLEQHLVSSPSG